MNRNCCITVSCALIACFAVAGLARGQDAPKDDETKVDVWVSATGRAAGGDETARTQALHAALRKAVEEACGLFLTGQSTGDNYKLVYDKVFANTAGYVREHKVVSSDVVKGVTVVKIDARVSTKKFEDDWASIAHTIDQENNPRVIVAIVESVQHDAGAAAQEVPDSGAVQTKIEDFFLSKGISLMDRGTVEGVTKRDVLLAAIKDDEKALASLGARFKADVVVTGRATAKFGKELVIAETTLYQYVATLTVRVIQTDSGRVLAAKSFDPITVKTLQRAGGEDKALANLGEEYAPKLLKAVVEAWRKRQTAFRTVGLMVSGMDFDAWKKFKVEAEKIRGIQALRLREITESVAHIDVEFQDTNEILAERLSELKKVPLKVVEISANRVKLQVRKEEAVTAEPE